MNWKVIFFIYILPVTTVNAAALEDMLGEFKILLYSVAAGVAALLLAVHGVKLKTASSPEERKEAKRGIIFVILGLVLIILAATVVELVYKIPPALGTEIPTVISAESWGNFGLGLTENQTGFRFEVRNEVNKTFTNVIVTVNALNYVSCDDDLTKFEFSPIAEFPYRATKTFSYENFCAGSKKFSVQLKSDQNIWSYCANCPKDGGSCNVMQTTC